MSGEIYIQVWFQGHEFCLPNEIVSFLKVSHHTIQFLDIMVPTQKLIRKEQNNLVVSNLWSFQRICTTFHDFFVCSLSNVHNEPQIPICVYLMMPKLFLQ